MTTGGRGWGFFVAAVSLSSLLGVGAVRSAEQAPAFLAEWLDGWMSAALPDAGDRSPLGLVPSRRHSEWAAEPVDAELIALARQTWELYTREVRGRSPLGRGADSDRLVPVLASRPEAHELVLRVPAQAVLPGAPVAHRDVLIGFVHELFADGTRATVRLLSHPASRPVAGEWRTAPTARPVHFLAYGRGDHLAVENRSSSVPPPPEQLAHTRDVKFLGESLPGGLLLGLLDARELDEPGGGLPGGELTVRVTPLFDALDLGLVVLPMLAAAADAASTGAVGKVGQAEREPVPARLLATSGAHGRLRLDRGASDGLRVGDPVVQDGVLVGRIEVLGRGSSEVVRTLPPEPLLIVQDDGQVVPCGVSPDDWPRGWTPRPGQIVVSGHVEQGGLLLGHIATVDDSGLTVRRAQVDRARPVLVWPR